MWCVIFAYGIATAEFLNAADLAEVQVWAKCADVLVAHGVANSLNRETVSRMRAEVG